MGEVVIHDWPLPYTSQLAERDFAGVDLVVIHCTELPDLATARSYGERELYDDGTGNSGHYYIDRSGATYNFVPDHRIAHHTRGFNPRSIGIELINIGRFPDWFDSRHQAMDEPYTATQIASLKGLLDALTHVLCTRSLDRILYLLKVDASLLSNFLERLSTPERGDQLIGRHAERLRSDLQSLQSKSTPARAAPVQLGAQGTLCIGIRGAENTDNK